MAGQWQLRAIEDSARFRSRDLPSAPARVGGVRQAAALVDHDAFA
jgi:hypothetical protein